MCRLIDKRKHFRSEPQNDIHKTNVTSAHARRFSRANNVMNIMSSVNIGPAIVVPAVPAPAPLN